MKLLKNWLDSGTWRHFNNSSMVPPPTSERSLLATGNGSLQNGLYKHSKDHTGWSPPNAKFSIAFPSVSTTFKFLISYNSICIGRVGQGAFLFLQKNVDNPVERWCVTSCITNWSLACLSKRCGEFCPPNTLRKVPFDEANQSFISDTTSTTPHDMRGGPSLKTNLYNKMRKWSVNFSITPLWLHSESSL